MPDYKETTLNGTQWQRCSAVVVSNPYNRTPNVTLQEETIAILGNETIQRGAGGINFEFDPSLVIPLRNPQTGELIPDATMTGMDVYVALYSLYILKAKERDGNN